ncbi:MAG: ImcF-related family protein [Acidobacteriaceae bacterium]
MFACFPASIVTLGSASRTLCLLAFFALQGSALAWLVGIVLFVLVVGAVILAFLHFRGGRQEAPAGPEESGERNEIDLLLRDVRRRLRQSQQGATSLESLPLLYFLGEAGSGKTTTVLQSGLDPELLAGSAGPGSELAPTQMLNVWFTRIAALVEIGAAVRENHGLLSRLVAGTRPAALRSAFGSGAPPRAAVVCIAAEQLLLPDGGASALAAARSAATQLREISRLLGMPIPVYAMVTKLDRVPHFEDFVRNLSDTEVRQILGSSVPANEASPGTYADQAARTLAGLFDSVGHQLAAFRPEVLQRETEPRNAGGDYEFPREFAKLRRNLTAWLVELCRPTHLNVNPYLRGFYFTGVRARVVEQAPGASVTPEPRAAAEAGATQYLNLAALRAAQNAAATPAARGSSRAPQWTFLARLLPEAILGDKAALVTSRQTAPARLFRRVLYGAAAALLALSAIVLVISWRNNASLEARIANAARALPADTLRSPASLTLPQLQALDQLRQAIVQLESYDQNGAPWTWRFGLYQGRALEPRARAVWFEAFRPVFLDPTQAAWIAWLRSLPQDPAATSDFNAYTAAYNPLKAYLITTSDAGHSQPAFLTPVFLQYWPGSRTLDSGEQALARKQVDFYGAELLRQPPYSIQPQDDGITHARQYLSKFLAETRIYQGIIADADKANSPVDFNKLYPDAGKVVIDRYVVPGAFTRAGYAFMQDAIAHPESHAQGEAWVLGPEGEQTAASADLSRSLAAQYSADFVKQWYTFTQSAAVVGCASFSEATDRLNLLADPNSPLLELFYTISRNTAVSDDAISSTFQPAHALVDPNTADRLVGPGNQDYIRALGALSTQLGIWTKNPAAAGDPTTFAPVLQAAGDAGNAAQQTAQAFKVLGVNAHTRIDGKLLQLMQSPVQCVDRLAPKPGAAANGGAGKICEALRPLLSRFPFAPNSTIPASLAQVDAVFAPDSGVLSSVDNAVLKPYLLQQGSAYVANPAAPQPVNPRFAGYFSRLARLSAELYPAGQKSATFSFTLHFLPGNGVSTATWIVDGQRIAAGSASQTFTWNGASAHTASLEFDGQQGPSYQGTWALFQLVRTGTHIAAVAGGYRIDYPIDTATTIAGHTVNQSASSRKMASFVISGPGAEILASSDFSGLACVGDVVR